MEDKWYKVSEKLPDDLEQVLLFFKDVHCKEVLVGFWDELNGEFCNGSVTFLTPCSNEGHHNDLCFNKEDIVYWRPLPCMPINEINVNDNFIAKECKS